MVETSAAFILILLHITFLLNLWEYKGLMGLWLRRKDPHHPLVWILREILIIITSISDLIYLLYQFHCHVHLWSLRVCARYASHLCSCVVFSLNQTILLPCISLLESYFFSYCIIKKFNWFKGSSNYLLFVLSYISFQHLHILSKPYLNRYRLQSERCILGWLLM